MSITIEFCSLEKSYGTKSLYQSFSGTVAGGSCACITGGNGSGKSTLLKLAAGLIRPSAGSIHYRSESRELPLAQVRGQIALASPEMSLYGALSAEENLHFFAAAAAFALAPGESSSLLAAVGLAGETQLPVAGFSTGMKQRLKLALVLASKRQIWLLDEPSANLDEDGRQLLGRLLRTARHEGHTVLLATNDPAEVAYADKVFRLS